MSAPCLYLCVNILGNQALFDFWAIDSFVTVCISPDVFEEKHDSVDTGMKQMRSPLLVLSV